LPRSGGPRELSRSLSIPGSPIALAACGELGYAFSWLYAAIGLATKDPETAQVAGILPFFVLMFASNAIVPVSDMPGWLQGFARNQPLSVTVSAVRALLEGGPVAHWAWQSLAWSAGILLVFFALALHIYRTSAS
jgi:ABC-2 type transport system permease protein/oleandomycin transport system permease protein